jgi:hypothetical protein
MPLDDERHKNKQPWPPLPPDDAATRQNSSGSIITAATATVIIIRRLATQQQQLLPLELIVHQEESTCTYLVYQHRQPDLYHTYY